MNMSLKVIVLFFFLALPINQLVSAQNVSQYEVKAAFIYNFLKFVEWPEDVDSTSEKISICVLGKSKTIDAINSLSKNQFDGKEIMVKEFDSASDFEHCNILYISPSKKNSLRRIFEVLNGKHVLTVSHQAGFAKQGGIINFFIHDDKLNFEINLEAANRAKLTISSRLLSLAKIVEN